MTLGLVRAGEMATRKTTVDKNGVKRSATRHSWGKIRALASGRVQASYIGPAGKRYFAPMTYSTRGDAEVWLAGQRTAIAKGEWSVHTPTEAHEAQAVSARSFGEYAAAWLEIRDVKMRTRDEYRRLLAGPIDPLAKKVLTDITPEMVDRWHAGLLATGRRTQSARAYGLLNAIMRTAVKRKAIPSNPCQIEKAQSKSTGRNVTPPSDAELVTILAAITPRYRALVSIAAAGGLRYGEATALRARDVKVERDDAGTVKMVRLDVARGVVRTSQGFDDEGGTKSSAGVRQVSIFGQDADIVAEHVKSLIGDALLFPARDGRSYLAQSAFWRHWNAAREAAGRPDMPFHALRHYAGTRYAQAGATPRETMARLGHSSIAASLRYQHSGNRDDELAARMASKNVSVS